MRGLSLASVAAVAIGASPALCEGDTLGSLISSGGVVTEMEVLSVSDEQIQALLFVEAGSSGFFCKVEAKVDADLLTQSMSASSSDEPISILGLKDSDASKWRKCAKIF